MKLNNTSINYPFAAIVGQEKLKKALLLCAVNPAIGGILIQGDKGTAKSTAARALAEVMPAIEQGKVPFITLPLGATEERVIGSLDLEAVLVDKKKKFQPGLLSAVHQGILYIDEVNLLSDHLVDVLLDVAASGENIIEREGLSLSHPSRFTLVGTMNPEEGQLRPQFLDRFGLMVQVDAPADIAERTEVVRRRIAFEADPVLFVQRWTLQQAKLQQQLLQAKLLLPEVILDDDLLNLISQLTTELNVRSLRADIVMYKTAITLAAFDLRQQVTEEDIKMAAELALPHRSKKKSNTPPASSPPISQPTPDQPQRQPDEEKDRDQGKRIEQQQGDAAQHQPQSGEEQIFESSMPKALPKIDIARVRIPEEPKAGRRSATDTLKIGAYTRAQRATNTSDIAIDVTVIHAVLRDPEKFEISAGDLHQKKRLGKMSNLILFIVDASGSMAARRRMEAVKGTVLSLLTEAYEKRDTVGVIAFRGIEAQVLLPPTKITDLAEEAMRSLPTGGRTPLPHALQTAIQLLNTFDAKKGYHPILIVLTDGKANVPLPGTGEDPWGQTIQLAGQLKDHAVQSLVINTESSYFNLDHADELAVALGAQYLSLSDISEEELTPIINQLSYKSR
ncbi:magnesium chelatase subunit D family protein [Pedobacter sp. MR2016-24]|uniref:magnesium chelatase subunit D family protein n=1 Tax=Pedobacter sp. MR2016-24 TaxID=2994466 RepID=UPI002247AB7E|nr:magnesium chelatase subunit D family protein [Pedobacter sp. MR2016-24]MCX2482774.1 magnesium chelatase subunit D family protein [Pedobacter sp. MR2016-24]